MTNITREQATAAQTKNDGKNRNCRCVDGCGPFTEAEAIAHAIGTGHGRAVSPTS